MSSAAHGRERGCATLGRVTNDDRERALAMTARRQDGCFTREQALANGHSAYGIRRAISTGRWTELLPDVLASSAAPASVATRERAAVASVEVVDEGVRHVFLDGVEISPGAAAAGR